MESPIAISLYGVECIFFSITYVLVMPDYRLPFRLRLQLFVGLNHKFKKSFGFRLAILNCLVVYCEDMITLIIGTVMYVDVG